MLNNSSFQNFKESRPIQIKLGCFFWVGLAMGLYGLSLTKTAVKIAEENHKLSYQNQRLSKNEEHLKDLATTEFKLGKLQEKIENESDSSLRKNFEKEKKELIMNHHQFWKCFCYKKQLNRTDD